MFAQLKVFIVVMLGIVLVDPLTATTNYCTTDLCGGNVHIACRNTGAFSSACTGDAKFLIMTTELENAIVAKHNMLRSSVALGQLSGYKPAIRMATMQWSSELAKMAVYNVKQCEMIHDACHNTPTFKNSGQNLAYSYWYGMSRAVEEVIFEHIQMWFDEYKVCSMAAIDLFQATGEQLKKIGHFTAMTQEKNTHVGCAVLRQTKNDRIYQFMACNYAYTNVFDKPVYRRGTTASKCSTGRNFQFPGLCSVNEKYNTSTLSY